VKSIVLLAGAMTLAATVAHARTLRLQQGHVVCRNLEQAVSVIDSPSEQIGTDRAMRMIQSGECIVLPKGEAVVVRYKEGRFSCGSPPAGGPCGWTMLMRQRR
jgi:hypothetical protein